MNEMPGSRGCASVGWYIATRQYGYPDGPRTTGRLMLMLVMATRVALTNANAAQRMDVPLTIRTTKVDLRAADQMVDIARMLSTRLRVPFDVVRITGNLAATVPSLAQVPLRIATL